MTDLIQTLDEMRAKIAREDADLARQIDQAQARRQRLIAALRGLDDLGAVLDDEAPPEVAPDSSEPPSAPVAPAPSKVGPWSDDFLADCYEEQLRGATVKQIADARGVAYNQFSSALKKFREALSAEEDEPAPAPAETVPPVATVPVDGKTIRDPDPDRAASGWSIDDDLQLIDDLSGGMKAVRCAELMGVTVESVKQRFALLVPRPSWDEQMKVSAALRALKSQSEAA